MRGNTKSINNFPPPSSFIFASVGNTNANSNHEEYVSDAGVQVPKTKEDRIFNMRCSNQRLQKKHTKVKSGKFTTEERGKESDTKK